MIDALFTSTSAVCVTGLIAIDTADHFTALGQAIVALLIQIGGLGVTSVGVGIMIAAGRKVGLRGRTLVKEALNVDSYGGLVKLVKAILITTVCFETAGAVLSFIVFVQDYAPLHALGISVFHSVALPSVRQLADLIGINMHTVNKAYSVLRQEGIVSIDRRKGAVICIDSNKLFAMEELKEDLQVALAKGICKNISRQEVHELIDEIYAEYDRNIK